jgi:hypothetical protein
MAKNKPEMIKIADARYIPIGYSSASSSTPWAVTCPTP